jgi:hypothetical protein
LSYVALSGASSLVIADFLHAQNLYTLYSFFPALHVPILYMQNPNEKLRAIKDRQIFFFLFQDLVG